MNIKVNFTVKLSKGKAVNEIIFIKGNKVKNNLLNPIVKLVLNNQLFQDQLFIQKVYKNLNYIFVNCQKLSKSSDYETIGSKLFEIVFSIQRGAYDLMVLLLYFSF